ncbi:hypothetical protein VTL71DRAFT_2683 [Oculimacula yallundae]|uniref:C2H2-type domain-containing protein n=1 Tax=Oculimacula yallundae TaxID=86028 RepID=A0ABR4CAB1_9HELO
MSYNPGNYEQSSWPEYATQRYPPQETFHLCHICGPTSYNYNSRKTLTEHIRSRHRGESTKKPAFNQDTAPTFKPRSEDSFECSLCDLGSPTFSTKTDLKEHKRREHEKQPYVPKRATCEPCDKSFSSKQALLKHQRDNVCSRNRRNRNTLDPNPSEFDSDPERYQSYLSRSYSSFQPSGSSQRADSEPERHQSYASQSYDGYEPSGSSQGVDQDIHLSDLTDEQFAGYLQSYSAQADDWNR